jgi:hypothetical protein
MFGIKKAIVNASQVKNHIRGDIELRIRATDAFAAFGEGFGVGLIASIPVAIAFITIAKKAIK